MAIRGWRTARVVDGPHRVRPEDITPLNGVFSDAFTDRYRKDGMSGVRVPQLNPAIWRYAIADAGNGAMLWRGERGEIAAFNIAHRSGIEGWMGPLAVRPEFQGSGTGKDVVRAGVDWLRAEGAITIGLETMPRTMDNIGFYSSLGFRPGRLTLTLSLDGEAATRSARLLGRQSPRARSDLIAECRAVTDAAMRGYDFTREIELTLELGLGDAMLIEDGDRVVGFALCHTTPLVEGRPHEELRVLKLVLSPGTRPERAAQLLADYARHAGARRVALRVQGEYGELYECLIGLGARVRWTDLRMTLGESVELKAAEGAVVLSNWEI